MTYNLTHSGSTRSLGYKSTEMTNVIVNQCCAEASQPHAVPSGHPAFRRQTSRPALQPTGRNSSTLSSSKAHAEAPWRTERMPHTSSDYETQEYTRYQLEFSWRQLLPEDKA
ncbi:hypothetical protein F7725_011274 [Dissostichus mawsoni]|uniref:Uncharacterized protein n=1 Tax=Dissostichus mawsoni TaxID=36200 RepID=A0A7J5Z930_DISMA|nr:hypothetical protein F7725_011274 [Dissostichus mawsoni]